MPKKFYTLEDLYSFCKKNDFSYFSAKDSGGPIIVQSLGEFATEGVSNQGLVPVTLQACHTELNRNSSFISKKVMEKALSSFANKPVLGYIHQLDDGTYDFYTHNVSYVEDENSEDGIRVEYDERPIGVIPESCNAHLSYDKEKDKTYVVVTGYIYEDYGNRAVEIIQNNGGKTKVSVEIAVNEMSYNAKEGYLNIEDFYFMGVTCLGKTPDGDVVQEGMEGSNLKLDNFSMEQNSMFASNYSDKIVDLLSDINKKLDGISNIQFNEKGVENEMNHFEELLEKYGKTVDDVDFEYESMTDEELDAKFAEKFDDSGESSESGESGESSEDISDESGEDVDVDIQPDEEDIAEAEDEAEVADEIVDEDEISDVDEDGTPKKKKVESHELKYELSHDDIRYALYSLLAADSEYYSHWIIEVYDNKFIYQDYNDGRCYRQKYSKDGDNIAFDGEPIEVFNEWLSKDEKDALDALKSDYAALKSFKDQYEFDKLKAEKDAIFESAEYAEIKDSDDFKALVADAEKYSVEEIKVKADLLFAASMKKKFSFEIGKPEKKHNVGINFSAVDEKKEAYGGLFSK